MTGRAEIERLRLEADTIVTRYAQVEQALEQARSEAGEHWDTGELALTLETPGGEEIDMTVDLDVDPASAAQMRYDRATELEADLQRRERVADQLAPLPADPVAYLLCYHLDRVEGNYPRSMAGHLDADRSHVEARCEEMEAAGLLERVESGTVKQRRVKAKQADEVRQHHTYYRLSREGDHLLRFLAEREGQVNALRHLPDGRRIVDRLARDGPSAPRLTAADLDCGFEQARHLYRALHRVGLVTTDDGDPPRRGEDEPSKPTSGSTHTYYVLTDRGETVRQELIDQD